MCFDQSLYCDYNSTTVRERRLNVTCSRDMSYIDYNDYNNERDDRRRSLKFRNVDVCFTYVFYIHILHYY